MSDKVEIRTLNGHALADTKAREALENKQPKGDYATRDEIPSVPVQSVNNKTGAVQLTAADVGAADAKETAQALDALSGEIAQKAEAYRIAQGKRNEYAPMTFFNNKVSGQPLHVVSEIDYNADGITSLTLEHYGKNMFVRPYLNGDVGTPYKDNNITFTVLEDGRIHVKGSTLSTRATYFRVNEFGMPLTWKSLSNSNYPNNLSDGQLSLNNGLTDKPVDGESSPIVFSGLNDANGRASIMVAKSSTVDVIISPQLENAYRPTMYEPGRRQDYTVDFGRAIHGGRYEWSTGVLTVTHDANGELAQPYTLSFEPQTITAYDGMNNLWSRGVGYNDITAFEPVQETAGFDPVPYNLPILYLEGDVSTMSKENAVTLKWFSPYFRYGGGTCECKWQGSTSVSFEKKNYTIKFDQAFEAATGWSGQKKYCFKANFIDHSHARNICSCKLWGEIVKSRTNVPSELSSLVNGGAIDGFPCVIMLNDEFHGVYTMNIPKDGWMFGTPKAILCADLHVAATQMKALATLDGDFELEYVEDEDNSDWVLTSLNTAIQAVIDSDGTDLDTVVGRYIDIPSAIDYYIHTVDENADDAMDKNYILVTFDGVKWYLSAYDRDSTYGLNYNGRSFNTPVAGVTFAYYASRHRLMELILANKKAELKARANELREGIKSEVNVSQVFSNYICGIPSTLLAEDAKKWPTIPSTSASNLSQILNWYRLRRQIIDKEIDGWS